MDWATIVLTQKICFLVSAAFFMTKFIAMKAGWLEEPPAALPSPTCVNFIGGEVLPHQRDPRWRKIANSYWFGGDIEVQEHAVLVVNGKSVFHLGEQAEASRLFYAIRSAQDEFACLLIKQRLRGLAAGPSLSEDDWRTLEQRFPDPDVPRRIAMP